MSTDEATVPEARSSEAPPLVEMVNVDKYFGALHVLKDINLTISRGEVIIVIGPSGSGKSTLCRAINRLEAIDSGQIRVDGEPLPEEGRQLARLRADVDLVACRRDYLDREHRHLVYRGLRLVEAGRFLVTSKQP